LFSAGFQGPSISIKHYSLITLTIMSTNFIYNLHSNNQVTCFNLCHFQNDDNCTNESLKNARNIEIHTTVQHWDYITLYLFWTQILLYLCRMGEILAGDFKLPTCSNFSQESCAKNVLLYDPPFSKYLEVVYQSCSCHIMWHSFYSFCHTTWNLLYNNGT